MEAIGSHMGESDTTAVVLIVKASTRNTIRLSIVLSKIHLLVGKGGKAFGKIM
jgi:hypothetical protein